MLQRGYASADDVKCGQELSNFGWMITLGTQKVIVDLQSVPTLTLVWPSKSNNSFQSGRSCISWFPQTEGMKSAKARGMVSG